MKLESRSSTGRRFDLALCDGDAFATLEVKRFGSARVGHWVVSGKSADGLPAMLLEFSVPMKSASDKEALVEGEEFASTFLFPMATFLAETPGAGDRIPKLNVGQRNWIFEEHMQHQFSKERSGSLSLQLQTQALFKMATFLEVVAPLKWIAEFQGVAVSTVETRIKKARAQGAIPRASVVRARNKDEKEGA